MARDSYHHGDLRQQLMNAAIAEIDRIGPAALSLRALARQLGVSHAAPAHHFGDKTGLLTAIALEGYQQLGAALGPARGLLDLGVRYAVFATTHRAHFEVMFTPALLHLDDAELIRARDAVSSRLRVAVGEHRGSSDDPADIGAAWAMAHGFAELWRSGAMPALLNGDTLEDGARRVLGRLEPG